MRENNELTQFSIYKINIEKVEETILLKEDDDVNSIKNKIIGYLKNYIKKGNSNYYFKGYIYELFRD